MRNGHDERRVETEERAPAREDQGDLQQAPELRDLSDEIALEQSMHVEVGTPFLERADGKLQERARAIIERRPDLERFFEN